VLCKFLEVQLGGGGGGGGGGDDDDDDDDTGVTYFGK
jgi:hypothetical protein